MNKNALEWYTFSVFMIARIFLNVPEKLFKCYYIWNNSKWKHSKLQDWVWFFLSNLNISHDFESINW